MGTFHDNLGELHGITVAVDTTGPRVYVGRCHEADDRKVILLDADEHNDGMDGLSKQDYLRRAAKWGVFAKHKHMVVDRAEVASITPLNQVVDSLDAG